MFYNKCNAVSVLENRSLDTSTLEVFFRKSRNC